jgi:putative transposase
MPEHIHMILSEPDVQPLATSVQILKQDVSRKLNSGFTAFWEKRYHDFNVYTNRKRVEKLRYLHRNPVKRGLVDAPERWKWSSFHHYATGDIGTVEIESPWTANRRAGIINLSLEHPVLVG